MKLIMGKRKISVNVILLTLLVWSIALFAYDKYNIKIVMLFITLLYNIELICNEILDFKNNKIIVSFAVIFPICLTFISCIVRNGHIVDGIKGTYVCFYLLLIFIIKKENFDICKALFQIMSFLSIIIVCMGILDFLEISYLYENPITQVINFFEEGMISKSPNAIFYYVIFIKTSPYFLFNLIYSLEKHKYFWAVMSMWAIMWSGTRANIYLAVFLIVIYYFVVVNNTSKKILFSLCCLVAGVLGYDFALNKIMVINWAKRGSDSVRYNIIPSVINVLNENKIRWFFGMGSGSFYYSIGRKAYVNGEEIAYLEFIRCFGLVGLAVLLFFLILPVKKIFFSEYRWALLPYSAFLISSFADPFLFTSTSFLIYVIIYDIYLNKI